VKPILLLVHGWGFEASFWAPLQEALGDVESLVWDLGFYGSPAYPAVPSGRPVLAVGHSFGLLWLLQKCPIAWHALASINGFPRFSEAEDFPFGVPSRLVDRMIARFDETPEKVYRDFMARCGVTEPRTKNMDDVALREGLKALRHWDGRSRMADLGVADLVLAGRADPIVPENLTESGFPGTEIQWHEEGHLLPLQAPEWCAAQLRRLSNGLSGNEPVSTCRAGNE
jgi:pimeloyl-[acyl-carrier protein] methyl ester esterase